MQAAARDVAEKVQAAFAGHSGNCGCGVQAHNQAGACAMTLWIPLDSPLRRPPDAMEPRQAAALDALRLSLDSVCLSWNRLGESLIQLMNRRDGAEIAEPIACAMCDAWAT